MPAPEIAEEGFDDYIRLINLEHADPYSGLIVCSLRKFARTDASVTEEFPIAPTYDALSYVWGPESPEASILLNGEKFYVRQNLWFFLYQAGNGLIDQLPGEKEAVGAGAYRPEWLWIDAICINQEDEFERSMEVQRMSSIYEQASQVIMWLGIEADHSEEAILYVNNAVKRWQYMNDNRLMPAFEAHDQPAEWLNGSTEEKQGLLTLLQRPYWKRLWVVQEVVLAERPMVACGRVMADLWAFTFFKWTMSNPSLRQDDFITAISDNWPWLLTPFKHSIMNRRGRCKAREDPGLFLHILERFYDRECQDPRDRVYGLIGMADPRHVPKVDYSLSTVQVFWQAMKIAVQGLPKFSQPAISRLAVMMGVTGWESDDIDLAAVGNLDCIYSTKDFTHAFETGSAESMAEVCQRVLLNEQLDT